MSYCLRAYVLVRVEPSLYVVGVYDKLEAAIAEAERGGGGYWNSKELIYSEPIVYYHPQGNLEIHEGDYIKED